MQKVVLVLPAVSCPLGPAAGQNGFKCMSVPTCGPTPSCPPQHTQGHNGHHLNLWCGVCCVEAHNTLHRNIGTNQACTCWLHAIGASAALHTVTVPSSHKSKPLQLSMQPSHPPSPPIPAAQAGQPHCNLAQQLFNATRQPNAAKFSC